MSIITTNRKACFNYFIEDRIEAGIALEGWEVKAIRAKGIQIAEAHVIIKGGEIVMVGSHITPLIQASSHVHADPTRTRKLLLHKQQLQKLIGKVTERGFTIVPLNAHFSKGRVKIEIGLAKGKKLYDKRSTIKERDVAREIERSFAGN
jgi:SsrA-binding protein